MLTLQGPDDGVVQVFLPQRYSDVMTESDLGELALGVYYFAKVKSTLLDHFYLSDPYFHVGAFSFAIRESVEHDENPDYSVYQITLSEETYTCLLGFVVTVTVPCGATSSINFTEFLWTQR